MTGLHDVTATVYDSRVYDSRHLQADCQEPGDQRRNPTLGNRVRTTFFMQGARRRTYVGRSGIVGSRSRRLVVVTMERPEIVVAGHRVAGIVGEERLSAPHHFRHPVQIRRRRQKVLYVTRTHAHTHPLNGQARDSEWQWHQLGHMQVCTSLQTNNHASNPPRSVFYRPDALPAAQSTASKH